MKIKCKYKIEYKEIKRGWTTQHLYCINGKEYPSVSSILGLLDDGKSGALMGWAKNVAIENIKQALNEKINQQITITNSLIEELSVIAKKEPERIKDEACDIGSQCHNAIDGYIKGEKYENYLINEKAKNAFNRFWEWFSKQNLKFITGDLPVVSIKYEYGGRLDALAINNKNKIVLLDWKTSNKISWSYSYQVAGYAIALEESYEIKPEKAYVIRFGKNDDVVEEKEVNLDNAKKAFKCLVRLYYLNQKNLFKEEI